MLCSLQMAELRPQEPAWLTAQDLADALRKPLRTIQWRIQRWKAQAATGLYPRVEQRSRACGGVECVVERESYERWLRGERIAA